MSATNNLPVLANPVMLDLPVCTLRWWQTFFELARDAATTFDELYACERAAWLIEDDIALRTSTTHSDSRLLDGYLGA